MNLGMGEDICHTQNPQSRGVRRRKSFGGLSHVRGETTDSQGTQPGARHSHTPPCSPAGNRVPSAVGAAKVQTTGASDSTPGQTLRGHASLHACSWQPS